MPALLRGLFVMRTGIPVIVFAPALSVSTALAPFLIASATKLAP